MTNKSTKAQKPNYQIKSIEKAFQLIQLMSEVKSVGITELSKSSGLSKANVYRIIKTLCGLKYVKIDDVTKKYELTLKLYSVSSSVLKRNSLVEQARASLEELSEKTKETINLGVLMDDSVFYLDKILSKEYLRIDTPTGQRDPCYCTALGKVLLSGLNQEQLEQYIKNTFPVRAYTQNTITDPKKFELKISEIRRNKYAVDREEIIDGVICVSAPIYDTSGEICAAISVTGPSVRMDEEKVAVTIKALKKISKKISGILF